MNMKNFRNAAVAILLFPAFSKAQQLISYQPEPDFSEAFVHNVAAAVKPHDAFAETAACKLADAKFLAPIAIEEAAKMLQPCAQAITARYAKPFAVKVGTLTQPQQFSAQVENLLLTVPGSLQDNSPLLRDLGFALQKRGGVLLGHRALVDKN
jgi:hypothetical protein